MTYEKLLKDDKITILQANLKEAKQHINELRERLVRETSTRSTAIRLMSMWRAKYDLKTKLEQTERDIIKTEEELFTRLREVGSYGGNEEAADDPAAETGH